MESTTPWRRYQSDLQHPAMIADEAQACAAEALQRVYEDLLARRQALAGERQRPRWQRWLGRKAAPSGVRGLYLWGGVGRGKTYLVDTFYDCLPPGNKLRLHFHHFMQRVHQELAGLKGEADPLLLVADRLAAEADLLCLDEFYVSDITDAMLLGGLLEALFDRGVTLVTTSNIEPDQLYRNGLQRSRFLPAIASLKQHCQVLNIDGGEDFRLRTLTQAELFHVGCDPVGTRGLADSFRRLAGGHTCEDDGQLDVNNRALRYRRRAGDLVWFDFAELCEGPRSQADYIELARSFHTLLLGGVPCLDETRNDAARRFIALIDELYDRRVKLLATLAVEPARLYRGRQLAFEFERTVSRLVEMQSHHYLSLAHRPQ